MRTLSTTFLTFAITTMTMATPTDRLSPREPIGLENAVVNRRQLPVESCAGFLLCCSLSALAGDPGVSPILALYGIGIGAGYHVGTGCAQLSSFPLASKDVCPAQTLCCTWAAANYYVGIDCEPVATNL
ncbi:hypothetical protein BJ912DRAFT_417945 [Pholiota molesta]|nr:hypothetical protein BJ912DRAFT_417945 [Pholiota molesta]